MKTLKGTTANKGKVKGIVKIIKNENDFDKFNEGDILVSEITNPSFTLVIIKASAIVIDKGGITSHSAIVSREFNIPCIVGTKNATQILKDGYEIEVDADNGLVKIIKE